MPDREQGYVRRKEGIVPPDEKKMQQYSRDAKEKPVEFQQEHQQAIINAVQTSCHYTKSRCHGISTDSTHIHVVMSWRDSGPWEKKRVSLKGSITRALNTQFGKRTWLVDGASRKRVRDQKHFDYLISTYLPGHRGLSWFEKKRQVSEESPPGG